MNDPRADRREIRRLKRRLRGLRWRCRLHTHLNHDYSLDIGENLKACRYCYTPNAYLGEGLWVRLGRWESAIRAAEDDGAIQTTPEEDEPPVDGPRLVARFWNPYGEEMPPLYHDPDHGLVCTWNYLTLVAPWLAATTTRPINSHEVKEAINTWSALPHHERKTGKLITMLEEATNTAPTTDRTGGGVTGCDGSTRARLPV
jgi:hypothetical protein